MMVNEKDHAFTECATFADIIKDTFGAWQNDWHFIDQAYLDEPGTTLDDFDFVMADVDVVSALTDLTAFLEGTLETKDSKYMTKIAQQFPDAGDQRSFALRMIIHYVGDIHQPLHGTSEVDHHFPQGDQGGNLHKLPADPKTGVQDLHAVWDSVIYEYPGYETLPLNQVDWDWYSEQTMQLEKRHPIDKKAEKVTAFGQWAQESLQMSEQLVYPGFIEHEKPDDEYLAKAKPALEARIVLAGYRLADLVIAIYKSHEATDEQQVAEAEAQFLQ